MGLAAVAVLGALLVSACGGEVGHPPSSPPSGAADGRLSVVTTVSPLTNIVANVAGGHARVEGIIPEGEDSHEFEPAPQVAKTLAGADIVFLNGLHLEEPTKKLAQSNLRNGAEIVELGNGTISPEQYVYDFSFPREAGNPNPHLWTNPPFTRRYAEIVRDTLSRRDPENAAAYAQNYGRYAAQIDAFDRALRQASATVPPEKRRLLTYHDSFPYFAREYGWTVIGAVQPSDFSDPTPKEVGTLIDQVRRERVPAIFGSEVYPSPVLRQIGQESGARYVDDLRDDDLPGRAGEPQHSLVSLLKFDYVTIVRSLGGDPSALAGFDERNPIGDEAHYPG